MGEAGESLEVARVALADGTAQRDFLAQCDLASRLAVHPHIVTIQDFGLADGAGYLTTSRPPGPTLADTLAREGSFTLAAALRIGVSLAGALQTAHQVGVVHCAVSPASIVLAPGRQPLLTDLVPTGGEAPGAQGTPGLVASSQQSTAPTATGDASEHAPPEVARGGMATPASDVYALASTIYTMLVGRTPQAARALTAAGPEGHDVAFDGLPPITQRGVPEELNHALERALVADPAQRTPTALDFAHALRQIQQQLRHPVTEPVVLDVAPTPQAPPTMAPDSGETAPSTGPSATGEKDRWWRSASVYIGAVAAVALVAGVVAILRATDTSDASDDGGRGAEDTSVTSVPSTEPTDAYPSDEAEDQPPPEEDDPATATPPANVTAVESAVGVQLDWDGDEGGRYVVLMLPESGDPRFLPAADGPSQLVAADQLLPDVGYCFKVAYFDEAASSPDEAADTNDDSGGFSDAACIRDATVESTG